jgi:hypothetical protein
MDRISNDIKEMMSKQKTKTSALWRISTSTMGRTKKVRTSLNEGRPGKADDKGGIIIFSWIKMQLSEAGV